MNATQPEIHAAQSLKQNAALRDRLEKVRSRLQSHISEVKREVDEISAALRVEYTGWMALIKCTDGKWTCVGCVKINDVDDDTPDDFDLALPIPKPETLPEFNGW